MQRPVTAEEVNALLKEASQTYLKGILGFEERPLVSTDYINDRRSGIVDAQSTVVVDGTHVKVRSAVMFLSAILRVASTSLPAPVLW